MIHGVTCRLPVYQRIFSCLLCIFPVIHFWSFVHQSNICRVVVMLCAVSYTVTEYEWIFPLCYGFSPVCHGLHPCSSLSNQWFYLQTPCVSKVFCPVSYSWAFVHQSSMFTVVDVLRAVRQMLSMKRIFPLHNVFPCVSWSSYFTIV